MVFSKEKNKKGSDVNPRFQKPDGKTQTAKPPGGDDGEKGPGELSDDEE